MGSFCSIPEGYLTKQQPVLLEQQVYAAALLPRRHPKRGERSATLMDESSSFRNIKLGISGRQSLFAAARRENVETGLRQAPPYRRRGLMLDALCLLPSRHYVMGT